MLSPGIALIVAQTTSECDAGEVVVYDDEDKGLAVCTTSWSIALNGV